MSEDVKLPPIYLLVKQIANGDFQLSIGTDRDAVKDRMINDGFRVFELYHEKFFEDLSS
jgi:hypothetical protein